jgi:hypothetical protein
MLLFYFVSNVLAIEWQSLTSSDLRICKHAGHGMLLFVMIKADIFLACGV